MKNDQKIDLGMTGYDELFMTDQERKDRLLPKIEDIPLKVIDNFPNHPFKVRMDEDMQQLVESIKERGLITPIILRKKGEDRYEIVSGHRRRKACELAGFKTIKAEVREMSRDEAIIMMVESNLQRSVILPSEKAFSYMNDISSHSETKTETIIVETDDGQGNIVEERHEESKTTLYITVSHKTAEEMAEQYGFTEEQKLQLAELLSEDKRSMWSAVLYGIRSGGDGEIVAVAQSQIGNEGGQKFWSWYGFDSRVSWCACFVSWCANECGYIEDGIIPKYSLCANAVEWFKDHDQWLDGRQEPLPGMLIFFDWDNHTHTGPQDGHSDHTGIVEKVENGIVYTIEGNAKDSVKERHYNVGHYEIMGYGVPAY